ncbi:MAG TPA: 5'-nucleotidase C-terminal domain-containing protein [Nocardioides sp.]|nr:5'-nucleotidase C-terminal domain-containing protein [Nocardioides sp.]
MLLASTRHRGLIAPTLLGLIAAPLAILATPGPAQAAGPGLVINEVYGGGGGGVATFENDFVELRNTGAEPVSLSGKSLQFRGPLSTVLPLAANVVVLPDVVVPAGETFLVKGASASGSPNPPGEPLPEPDLTTTLNLGGVDGQIFLADTTVPTNPNLENGTAGNTFDANVLDFVGYGPATSFEGAAPTPTPTAADSVSRNAEGADTDSNGTDFTVSAPPGPTACTGCASAPQQIQILATNDFHGRLVNEGAVNGTTSPAGAAVLSGAVKQLRAENPNTAFVAAGDLIGASTFESFIQQDVPTIEALNEAGLDVSAVGNHELDQGFDDLDGRVQGLADWEYIVANLRLKEGGDHALAPTWTQELGGVTVGYVGAVTEELPALVSPAGIANLDVTDVVTEVNDAAADLRTAGADLVVMLVHEGAPNPDCATMDDDPSSTFGNIINNVSADVDAIVSGHTHLAYDCSFPVEGFEGGRLRPVVSAGQYGTNLNQIEFTVSPDDGAISVVTQDILALEGPDPDGTGPLVPPSLYPADPLVETIVADAVAQADVLGADPLGDIEGPYDRARWSAPDGDDPDTERDIVENRGGESTLGNLVAEVQRWATESETFGGAEIAFMNPGGLRANMAGPTVTYKQAAGVQPFANTLVNMDLTGAQIKTVLEQQWQRDAQGNVPTRPFLRLGTSEGFEYSYDLSLPEGDRITGIWLNDEPIGETTTYSVTVNSFLAAGGDNFREFANGTNKADTGQIDLQAMVDYMAEFAGAEALDVRAGQHSVGATVTDETITLTSLSMTGANDPTDAEVEVFDGATSLGTFPVTSALTEMPLDESGTATLPNTLPDDGQLHLLRIVGETTGTDIVVPVTTDKAPAAANLSVTTRPGRVVVDRTRAKVTTQVRAAGSAATGRIEVKAGGRTYKAKLENGRATVTLKPFPTTGKKQVKVIYLGNATTLRAVKTVTIKVVRKR